MTNFKSAISDNDKKDKLVLEYADNKRIHGVFENGQINLTNKAC